MDASVRASTCEWEKGTTWEREGEHAVRQELHERGQARERDERGRGNSSERESIISYTPRISSPTLVPALLSREVAG